ncbi:unnamed protein product [Rotaria sordida]|uniref:Nuclear receptor domain-containing protein n=2 Tax=Rotaria sordida TaxID=392033 RepID=A0A819CUM7_9BILA|nr:unnamed protein product [Rotaria sordida]
MVSSTEMINIIEGEYEMESIEMLECRVCGGPAHGYNFDQISCDSCKAFFRRNALRYRPKLKCRYNSSCEITVETRRLCTYCRLKKCFDIKMRKEWIRTEEECRVRKLQRLSTKQNKMNKSSNISTIEKIDNQSNLLSNQFIQYKQPIFTMNKNFYSSNLTFDDWSLINNIKHAYDTSIFDYDTILINNSSLIDSTLKDFINDKQQIFRSLIQFYKKIPHFKQINLEDQILLIKCNISHLIHIHYILKDNFIENSNIDLYLNKWINSNLYQQMSKIHYSFNCFIQYPIVLIIVLVAFMFIINLSRLPDYQLSLQLIDRHLISEHHNFFITLLWKYLNVIYDKKDAIQAIEFIVFQFLRYQLLIYEMGSIILNQINPDQFHPLMKSVLCLT